MTHSEHFGNHILYDGCFRCREHAHNPFGLDDGHFRAVVALAMKGVCYGDRQADGTFVSENDVFAASVIKDVLNQYRRIEQAGGGLQAIEVRA